jgi:hypothetical protein
MCRLGLKTVNRDPNRDLFVIRNENKPKHHSGKYMKVSLRGGWQTVSEGSC